MAGRKKSTIADDHTVVQDMNNKKKRKVVKRKKSEIGLYEHIKKKTNVDKILDEWIGRYKIEAEEAVWELVLLIFDCGGAVTTITYEQFKELEIQDAAKDICEQEDSIQYPLGSKRSKNFLENFKQFWSQIIIKTQESILFDHYLLDMMVLWFIQTSHAKRSGLRYASTLATIQMATSMIEIAVKLRNDLSVVSRQLASETKNTSRQKQLKDNQISITNKLKMIESTLIQKIFNSILHDRFKDSLPEIRSMCLAPLAQWILRYPILLLSDNYLKYFGWALNDFASDPRLTSVRGLSVLFGDEDRVNQFENFSQRFKHRIIEIAFCDKVPAITVEGIKLVSVMSPYDFLDEHDVLKICKLYQIDHPEISSAAGSLIFNKFLSGVQTKIDAVYDSNNNNGIDSKKKQDKSNSQIIHLRENQLNILLEFLEKTAHSNIPYYLVYALWDTKARDLFTDWPFWVDYLESIESKNISDKQLGIIVNFLNSSIRIATGDKYKLFNVNSNLNQINNITTIVTSTATTKTTPTKRKGGRPGRRSIKNITTDDDDDDDDNESENGDNENQDDSTIQQVENVLNQEICTQVTTNFLNLLPDLIIQYRADSTISQGLIEIAKYFVLDCYVSLRAQSKYSELLEAICSICLSQPKIELINAISETLDHLINNDNIPSQLETTSKNALHNLHTELVDVLHLAKITPPSQSSQSIQSTDDQRQQDDQIFQVIVALRKLDSLGKRFHFSDEKYASTILQFTTGEINGIEIETQDDSDDAIILSLSIYSQLLLWSFFSIIPEKPYHIDPTNLNIIQSLYLFVSKSILLLNDNQSTHKLKHFVFTTLIETRTIFSPVLELTNLNSYNIGFPIESLLQKTIDDLIKFENEYSIRLLKVEFLKNQQSNLEKKKLAIETRSKRLSALKSKKNEAASATTLDGDDDDDENSESNSEKDTTTDHETESSGGENQYQILESEIKMVNEFVYDDEYSKRMEDLAITICNSITYSFVSEVSIVALLKQIAISSSTNCNEIIRQFIKDKPASTPKLELDIVCYLIKSFHEICIDQVVSTNKEFQQYMFARFRSLIQYLASDYIKNTNTLKHTVDHFLTFALKNPNVGGMVQFLEIIQFICTKLSEQSSIDILKKRLVFPDDYPHLDSINNIYNTIEFQTIQNMDIADSNSKKRMRKQQLKFKSSSSSSTTTSSNKVSSIASITKSPTKKRRSRKNQSSDEESSSDSEYENEKNQHIEQQEEEEEEILQDDIDPDLQQRESSEESSDFEPAEISKKKLRTNK